MFGFVKKLFGKKSPDPVALVILESEPRMLSRGHVSAALSAALGREFPESLVAEEGTSYHRVFVDGFELTVCSSPNPYVPKDRADSRDLRLDDVIRRHEAAVLVDCWGAPPGVEREAATDLMGRIVAALADDTSLAVYAFHTQRLNPLDDKLMAMLAEGEGFEAMRGMTFDPVVPGHVDDEALNSAMREARDRWPEFVSAFAGREEDDGFIVKARFDHPGLPEGENAEHLWMEVTAADAKGADGEVQSEAIGLPRPRKGDRVRVPVERISDWLAITGPEDAREMKGNFTDAVLRGEREPG